jgi:hypothetical protein
MPRSLLPYSLSFIYPALHFFSSRLSILYSFIFFSFNPSHNPQFPPFLPAFLSFKKHSKPYPQSHKIKPAHFDHPHPTAEKYVPHSPTTLDLSCPLHL